jgi:hypothetical protein
MELACKLVCKDASNSYDASVVYVTFDGGQTFNSFMSNEKDFVATTGLFADHMNCLHSLERWDPRFESHSRHG